MFKIKYVFILFIFLSCNNHSASNSTYIINTLDYDFLSHVHDISIIQRSTNCWLVEYKGLYKLLYRKISDRDSLCFLNSEFLNIDTLQSKKVIDSVTNSIELPKVLTLMHKLNSYELYCVPDKGYITLHSDDKVYYYSKTIMTDKIKISENLYYEKIK